MPQNFINNNNYCAYGIINSYFNTSIHSIKIIQDTICNIYQITFYYVMLLNVVGILVCDATKTYKHLSLFFSQPHPQGQHQPQQLPRHLLLSSHSSGHPQTLVDTPTPPHTAHCSLIPSNSSYQKYRHSVALQVTTRVLKVQQSLSDEDLSLFLLHLINLLHLSNLFLESFQKYLHHHHHALGFHFPNTLLLSRQGWVCLLIYFDILPKFGRNSLAVVTNKLLFF